MVSCRWARRGPRRRADSRRTRGRGELGPRQQHPDRGERAAVPVARSLADEGGIVAARPVPLVPREPVAREACVHLVADPVARHLGHDRCGGDGRGDGVAVDDRPLRVGRLADGQGVDQQVVRRLGQVGQRLAHGELGGLQDVDPVDDLDLDAADTEWRRREPRSARTAPPAGCAAAPCCREARGSGDARAG